ncbi:MAG: adenylate/guanylate cyclase domain-containing protein [Acidimicrobiia bacterium]
MPLPGGVVTFVFSDIEGSTRLWESEPEAMRQSLARHDDLVSAMVEEAGGAIFKHTGDGFGAAFASVSAALESAARVAAAVAEEAWPGPSLSVRLGVHTGEAEPRGGDYFGPTVTRAARVTDAANGGQILVAESSHQLVRGVAPNGTAFVHAGEHRLKDLGEPIGLYRLVGPGAGDERQLRTLEQAPHNFPVQLSSFIGREAEIKELADLVRTSRLVTLTGIGGVGKTRLSLQVAAEILSDFDHGAWFVELAPLAEPGLLPDTVAEELGVPQDSTLTAETRTLRYLAKRSALLVIDNCEHLIDDVAGFVDRLLRSCPDVHVLATSREGLAVTGEVLWKVPSLRVDDDAAAVVLFAERARLVRPDFTVTDDNRELVARLCVRLDGIPLAIELATARLPILTLEQIAEHLADRFRLLTGGSRTAVERQRTLRAMMDWSYGLLGEKEQTLLRRLSVFSDGFTFAAAEDVCSDEAVPRLEVLDLLQRLVEASMVTFESDLRPRYRLLETVRQYSLDKLLEAGDSDRVRLRHAEYFKTTAGTLRDRLERGDEAAAMEDGQADLGNFRSAMIWAAEAGHGETLLGLAVGLRPYFWNRVMYRESVRWLTTAIDMTGDNPSTPFHEAVAFALTDAGNSADADTIERYRPLAERLYESAEDDLSKGSLANALGALSIGIDARRADELFRSAHQTLRRAGSPRWTGPLQNRFITAWFLNSRESEEEVLGLVEEAVAEGLAIHQAVVETTFLALAEEYEAVIDKVERDRPKDDWEKVMLLLFQVVAERALGRLDDALETVERAATILGPNSPGTTEWHESMILIQQGDLDGAIAAFDTPYKHDYADAFSRLTASAFWAMVSEHRGDHETAALLWGFRDRVAEASSLHFQRFEEEFQEESRTRSSDAMGAERFAELVARGGETPWEDLPLVRGERAARGASETRRPEPGGTAASRDGPLPF